MKAVIKAHLRRVTALFCTAVLVAIASVTLALPASAARAVRVTADGSEIVKGKARIVDSTTYVPFRAFAGEMDGATVTWSASQRTARATSSGTTVTATVGQSYLTKNGTRINSTARNRLIGGTLYVPVRPMATAYGYTVSWDHASYSAVLTKKSSGGSTSTGGTAKPSYSENDLYWLARIIEAEAGGESYYGKLAVGTVIMNRVKSKSFPNTVYGVIFDRRYGIQFIPAYNGMIYRTPSQASVSAAKEVLLGYRVPGNIQYFLNPALASDRWFRNNLTYVTRIGNHVFYAP